MSYVKSNPNFQPRQTQWGNNVTVINKDEALIKLHLRKGIPLPPELQVSGCSTPTSCLPFAHAPRHPIAPAELQASGCLLTPHASRRTPCASRLAWHCKSHAARRTPHAAPQVSRLAPHATAHDWTGEEGEARGRRCREQVGRLQPIRRRQGGAAGQVFRDDQAGRALRAACGEGLRDDQAGRRLQPACGQGHRRGARRQRCHQMPRPQAAHRRSRGSAPTHAPAARRRQRRAARGRDCRLVPRRLQQLRARHPLQTTVSMHGHSKWRQPLAVA